MKTMTKNLKYFSGLTLLFSIAFFYYLYAALQARSYDTIWLFALLFGLALFTSGFILGYKDPVRGSRADLGLQYHFVTFIIVNTVGIPWLFVSMGLNSDTLLSVALQCIPWGTGLFLHYYLSSGTIKGMHKDKLFD